MLRELVVLLVVTSVALASVAIQPLQPKPDKFKDAEGCYIKDLDNVISIGSSAACPHHCMEYRCRSNIVEVATCGTIDKSSCFAGVLEDHSKPYPYCCPECDGVIR